LSYLDDLPPEEESTDGTDASDPAAPADPAPDQGG
jgi:hypothetical protein